MCFSFFLFGTLLGSISTTFILISVEIISKESQENNCWTQSNNSWNIVAALRGMHVSPAKHSYEWLPRKCDYWTDRHMDRQTPDKVIPMWPLCFTGNTITHENIVAAFQGMHVSPAKHSYAWLPRKCDYRRDRHTDRQADGWTDAGQSDPYVPLCFCRRHKKVGQLSQTWSETFHTIACYKFSSRYCTWKHRNLGEDFGNCFLSSFIEILAACSSFRKEVKMFYRWMDEEWSQWLTWPFGSDSPTTITVTITLPDHRREVALVVQGQLVLHCPYLITVWRNYQTVLSDTVQIYRISQTHYSCHHLSAIIHLKQQMQFICFFCQTYTCSIKYFFLNVALFYKTSRMNIFNRHLLDCQFLIYMTFYIRINEGSILLQVIHM